MEKEVYLGDGLYVLFDGFSFNLRGTARGGWITGLRWSRTCSTR